MELFTSDNFWFLIRLSLFDWRLIWFQDVFTSTKVKHQRTFMFWIIFSPSLFRNYEVDIDEILWGG